MSELLKDILVRMLCTGIICTIATIMAGDTVVKEPVRLCCAALVIVMLLTPLKNGFKQIGGLSSFNGGLKESIAVESQKAEYAQQQIVDNGIEYSIKIRLAELINVYDVDIETNLSKDVFEIACLTVLCDIDGPKKDKILDILSEEYGIDREKVMFAEVE